MDVIKDLYRHKLMSPLILDIRGRHKLKSPLHVLSLKLYSTVMLYRSLTYVTTGTNLSPPLILDIRGRHKLKSHLHVLSLKLQYCYAIP
jgi:hypothetical protein